MILILGALYLIHMSTLATKTTVKISYGEFYKMVAGNKTSAQIKSAEKLENVIRGELFNGSKYTVNIPDDDPDLLKLLRENVSDFNIEPPKTFFLNIFFSALGPILLIILLWFFIFRGAAQGEPQAYQSSGRIAFRRLLCRVLLMSRCRRELASLRNSRPRQQHPSNATPPGGSGQRLRQADT